MRPFSPISHSPTRNPQLTTRNSSPPMPQMPHNAPAPERRWPNKPTDPICQIIPTRRWPNEPTDPICQIIPTRRWPNEPTDPHFQAENPLSPLPCANKPTAPARNKPRSKPGALHPPMRFPSQAAKIGKEHTIELDIGMSSYAYFAISFAFSRTSLISPTYKNACSGRSSALPEQISSKLLRLSASLTYLPSLPVNCWAT